MDLVLFVPCLVTRAAGGGDVLQMLRNSFVADLQNGPSGSTLLRWLGWALLAALVVPLVAHAIKRQSALERHAHRLERLGFDDDEVRLFVRIARRATLQTLRGATIDLHRFDKLAHGLLHGLAPRSLREQTMLRIVELRQRLPDDGADGPVVEAGSRLFIAAALPVEGGSYRADVVTTNAGAMLLALPEADDDGSLVPGATVRLKSRMQGATCETLATIRRRYGDPPGNVRLDVLCRAPFLRSRTTLRERAVDMPARLALVERVSATRSAQELAPQADGRITRDASLGVYVTLRRARLVFGERVRVSAEPYSGDYLAFAEVSASADHEVWFLVRLSLHKVPRARAGAAPPRALTRR